ncbi:MAG: hypothetical protein B7Z80_15275 [Rhodospirillales bacterium 20-64-7]|nr:MAG: hypothetical protein B7Z80_15275 [Rhodospirillales bacterium 20-64-7]
MATPISIIVRNNSPTTQNFFFFQQPAVYSGGPQVYTNSLFTSPLLPYAQSGSVLTFSLLLQYYAGVQQQVAPPVVGQPSGFTAAIQPIGLTPISGPPPANTTNMSANPLGLTPPVPTTGPQTGSFRIVVPTFNPALQNFNAGSAVQNLDQSITLSNFVTASPTTNLDCQPVLIFYVQTGTYTPGTVMNFTASSQNAAVCNFTPGYPSYTVVYNADGTWTSTPNTPQMLSDAALGLGAMGAMIAPPAPNTNIYNEAGSALLSTGYAAGGYNPPFIVSNLSNAGPINVNSEYQVEPIGGQRVGRMCVQKNGNTVTFGR